MGKSIIASLATTLVVTLASPLVADTGASGGDNDMKSVYVAIALICVYLIIRNKKK